MSDNKARRVHLSGAGHELQGIHGDFMLVPVEVWERVVRQRNHLRRTIQVFRGEMYRAAAAAERRALAEIGGGDE